MLIYIYAVCLENKGIDRKCILALSQSLWRILLVNERSSTRWKTASHSYIIDNEWLYAESCFTG